MLWCHSERAFIEIRLIMYFGFQQCSETHVGNCQKQARGNYSVL